VTERCCTQQTGVHEMVVEAQRKRPLHTGRAEHAFNRSPEILSQWPLNELLISSESITSSGGPFWCNDEAAEHEFYAQRQV
jgi:hypothetical protein